MSTDYEVKSVSKAISIITALFNNGCIKGMTREELAVAVDITYAAAYRMLKTLEGHGWVKYSETTKLWMLSTIWATYSRGYDLATAQKHNEIDEEYFRMTGEKYDNAKIN